MENNKGNKKTASHKSKSRDDARAWQNVPAEDCVVPWSHQGFPSVTNLCLSSPRR